MKTWKLLAGVLVGINLMVVAAPAMAMESMMKSDRMEKRTEMSAAVGTCLKPLVMTREDSAASAFSTFSNSISSAMTTRKLALENAYSSTDAKTRRDGIQKAWNDFRASKKAARDAFNTSRKSAWSSFKTGAKSCKGEFTNENSKTESSEGL